MILAEMEDSNMWHHSNIIDEVFQLSNEYDEGLLGWKNKQKSCFSPLNNYKNEEISLDSAFENINEWNMAETLNTVQADGNEFLSENNTASMDNVIVPVSIGSMPYLDVVEEYLSSCSDIKSSFLYSKGLPGANQNGTECDMFCKVSQSFQNSPETSILATKEDLSEQMLMRKKSISQALVWYQNSRKRKLSFSGVSVNRSRNGSGSWDPLAVKSQTADSDVAANVSRKENAEPLMGVKDCNSIPNRITLNCSDMEVYGRIPSNCLNHNDDSPTVPSLTSQTDRVNLETLISMSAGYSIHYDDGFLWEMNIFEENKDFILQNNPCTIKSASDNVSYGSNLFGYGVDARSDMEALKIESGSDIEQHVNIESNSALHVKCELPSEGVTFPDEIGLESLTNFDEYHVSGNDSLLNYFSLGDLLKETEVRRKPGRPRKKSLSQSIAWYRSHRKRQASMSNSSIVRALSNSSNGSCLDDSSIQSDRLQCQQPSSIGVSLTNKAPQLKVTHKNNKLTKKSRNVACKRQVSKKSMSRRQSFSNEFQCHESEYSSTTVSYDSEDDDAIVDVVTVSGSDSCDPADARLYLPLIQAFHNYCSMANATAQHHQVKNSNNEAKFKLVWSLEQCPSSLTPSNTCPSSIVSRSASSKQRSFLSTETASSIRVSALKRHHRGFHIRKSSSRASDDQKMKREALNDLERQRRREMTREITALRVVVPAVRDNSRAAKVTILDAAANQIGLLELTLERNKSVLTAELQKMVQLKARLANLLSSQ